MATLDDQIISQIKRDEGLSLKLYYDTMGNVSIGYGRNLTANGIRQDEADLMVQNDYLQAKRLTGAALPWAASLADPRYAVLVEMAFNMGILGLLGFHVMLGALQAGDFQAAAAAMLNSEWAKQVGDRAARLSQQMETNSWV